MVGPWRPHWGPPSTARILWRINRVQNLTACIFMNWVRDATLYKQSKCKALNCLQPTILQHCLGGMFLCFSAHEKTSLPFSLFISLLSGYVKKIKLKISATSLCTQSATCNKYFPDFDTTKHLSLITLQQYVLQLWQPQFKWRLLVCKKIRMGPLRKWWNVDLIYTWPLRTACWKENLL